MYASANGKQSSKTAHFEWFEYVANLDYSRLNKREKSTSLILVIGDSIEKNQHMKRFLLLLIAVFCVHFSCSDVYAQINDRLVILADMGNEPDEEQQMTHLLMYANEVDLEGLIAVTGKFLPRGPRPDLFFMLIAGYEKVVDNLRLHADGWPDPSYLRSTLAAGQDRYGMADVGNGKSSPGSRLIVNAMEKPDPRPLYIVVNAGSNTLAQALVDFEEKHGTDKTNEAVTNLRVFENGAQDNAGAWICNRYPDIHWFRSNYQTYAYAGPSIDGAANNRGDARQLGPHTWQPYQYSGIGQHQWALQYIKGNNGPLLALWPIRQFTRGGISFLEGGGTIPWFALVNKGLSDINKPWWGGWSGRTGTIKVENYWSKHGDVRRDEEQYAPFYTYPEEADKWTDPETGEDYDCIFTPVWRWRRAFFNNFAARAQWCNRPYEEANHNPVAVIDGDDVRQIINRSAQPGDILVFDASGSFDPDGDSIAYKWFVYPEAGTYQHPIHLDATNQDTFTMGIPDDAGGSEIHLILELTDDKPDPYRLFSYRRIIIKVRK